MWNKWGDIRTNSDRILLDIVQKKLYATPLEILRCNCNTLISLGYVYNLQFVTMIQEEQRCFFLSLNVSIETDLFTEEPDIFVKDFWQSFFANPSMRFIFGPASFLTVLILVPAFFGILYYISQRHIKTVLLHSERIIFVYACAFTSIPFAIDLARIYTGPLHPNLCWWYKYFKNVAALGVQFGFIITILSRVSVT